MIYRISGKDNKTAKSIKLLYKKSERRANGRFVAEGRRISEEAFECAAERIYCTVVSESFAEKNPETVEKADKYSGRVYIAADSLFWAMSDTDTPQGILQVMNMNSDMTEPSDEMTHIVVLDAVSEPGNMGTIIRTAEALGFDGIYLMKGCVDIYGAKTVRSTMGSLFRMNFKTDCTTADIAALQNRGFKLISTTPSGDTALETFKTSARCAVVIGNEAHGVSEELLNMSDVRLKITMGGKAESLNAAVAAGIVMHGLKNF